MSVELHSSNEEAERVELFSIDGVAYTIPAKVKTNVQLKYMHFLNTEGEVKASYVLLSDLLGTDGYEALMNYDDLTPEDFNAVVKIATAVVLGQTEESLGKAQKKSSKSK